MEQNNHKLIVTIVNRGKGGTVVDISHKAGATGGTILFGHGTAVRLMLGISIEPEQEAVLTLIREDKAQKVFDAIAKEMDLDKPQKGIAFMVPLDQVVGLRKEDE